MGVLIKVLIRSILGVLTVGLLGCGCLFPSTPSNTLTNLYIDLHAEAESLRYNDEYKAALEKYEHAFKIRPRPAVDAQVIDVSYLALFKYRIAFCYAKLAEEDASLYIKAEEMVKESYQTARLRSDKIGVLYLWGYILFKQARYEEARTKYEELLDLSLENRFYESSTKDAVYAHGKTYLELGEEAIAPRAFGQLQERFQISLQNKVRDRFLEDALYRLGGIHSELGDAVAARRVFGQLEEILETFLQREVHDMNHESFWDFYYLAESYLELGDKAAALRVFRRFEELFETSLQRSVDDDSLASVWSTLAESYLELGDKTAALRIFKRFEETLEISLQRGTRERGLDYDLYSLGIAYMELGEEVAARKVFVQLLEHFPDSLYKAKAEGFLGKQ